MPVFFSFLSPRWKIAYQRGTSIFAWKRPSQRKGVSAKHVHIGYETSSGRWNAGHRLLGRILGISPEFPGKVQREKFQRGRWGAERRQSSRKRRAKPGQVTRETARACLRNQISCPRWRRKAPSNASLPLVAQAGGAGI